MSARRSSAGYESDGAVTAIVRELHSRFGVTATSEVVGCVRRSIHDLRGSTSPESLPEMAVRLALVRLAVPLDSTTPGSH